MSYSVSPSLYREVAGRLHDAIDGRDYFSGTVALLHDGVECRLTLSVLVYRRRDRLPEGDCYPARRLVPVWWEFHTTWEGVERLNDFDFTQLAVCMGCA